MPPTATCDGDVYLHNLSTFIKSHERQLANALLAYKKQPKNQKHQQQLQLLNSKPVRLSLTLHHLYYILERFQDLGISVGPMNIRLDNIYNDDTSLNYVSFLSDFHQNKRMSSDAQSIHSMTSVKSVMSSVSALWSSMGTGSGINSREVLISDLKYLYSAFTKLPCLRLAPDSRAKLIEGHEEDPFDTLVPLKSFKNLSVLEVCDLNLKEIYGWNFICEQIKFLVLKKTGIVDPVEVLVELVEEDYHSRGSFHDDSTLINNQDHPTKHSSSFSMPSSNTVGEFQTPYQKKPHKHHAHLSIAPVYSHSSHQLSGSLPDTHYHGPQRTSPTINHATLTRHYTNDDSVRSRKNTASSSTSSLVPSSSSNYYRRSNTTNSFLQSTSPPASLATRRLRRSNSNASEYSNHLRSSPTPPPTTIPITANRWRHLKHLSFTENNICKISDWSFEPLQSLSSLDLSHNKLTEIPSLLSHLKNLKSLNLSYNKLTSTKGFQRNELQKLTVLNLKSNKLTDLNSLEFLKNLDKLDVRSNKLEITSMKPLLMGDKPLKLQLLFLQNNNMKNYRIELFNLFNGIDYDNNLKIDGSRPGIFESRLLLDSKNAELKLNNFFISQITNSISSMSLSQLPTPEPTETKKSEDPKDVTTPTLEATITDTKEYVLLPPLKPFMRPLLDHLSSQDTITSSLMQNSQSTSSKTTQTGIILASSTTTTTMVHSPSLILKSGFDSKDTSLPTTTFDFPKQLPITGNFPKTTPSSPRNSMFPLSLNESPRTASSSGHVFASKLNRLSNDLSSIVSTSNSSHELLAHKLLPPLPPVITTATSAVNSTSNSNSSSQRTSLVSTQLNTTNDSNKENNIYKEEFSNTRDETIIQSNPNINHTISYLINNE